MGGWEPAESNVKEKERRSEKQADASRDANKKWAPRVRGWHSLCCRSTPLIGHCHSRAYCSLSFARCRRIY